MLHLYHSIMSGFSSSQSFLARVRFCVSQANWLHTAAKGGQESVHRTPQATLIQVMNKQMSQPHLSGGGEVDHWSEFSKFGPQVGFETSESERHKKSPAQSFALQIHI